MDKIKNLFSAHGNYSPGCPCSPSPSGFTLKFKKQYCTNSSKLTEPSFSDGNLENSKSISDDVNLTLYLKFEIT